MKIPRSRTTLLLLTLFVAATLTLPTPVQARGGRGPHGPDRCIARHADELGVDVATVAKIEAIVAASQSEVTPLRDALRTARAEMQTLLNADRPDEAAVMAQADRVSAAMAAMHKHHLATLLKIRALLTPEQRGKLEAVCGPGGQGGHGGGPGPGAEMGMESDDDRPCAGGGSPGCPPGAPCGGPPPAPAGRW